MENSDDAKRKEKIGLIGVLLFFASAARENERQWSRETKEEQKKDENEKERRRLWRRYVMCRQRLSCCDVSGRRRREPITRALPTDTETH